MTPSLQNVVGLFSSAEFLGNYYVRDPLHEVIALCSKKKYAEEIVDALNAMMDSKEKCKRNRNAWKARAVALEEALKTIAKRDDWTSGECRHHAKATLEANQPNLAVEGRTAKGQQT